MKTIKSLALTILGGIAITSMAFAQNYKAPKIDASGKFTDGNGVKIGTMTKDGMMDEKGMKMAHIDNDGNLVDSKTGKKIGKAEKNGNFMYMMSETGDGKNFTIGAPSNGVCEVKDENGKVVLLVHENYKMQAACAYHCAQTGMTHGEMLDKSKATAMYACPMHPEITSDKPAKCSKCGMDMKKQ